MKNPVFIGSSVAIVTPFSGGQVDYDALGHIIDIQKNAGTAAITICGTTGEASTLTRDEKLKMIAFAKKRAGALPVIAGTGSNDTAEAVRNAGEAEIAGADAVLVVTPYYNKGNQAGLREHFLRIADSVTVPVILYNVPSRTGVSLTAESYRVLAAHENINGVKEASGDFALLEDTLAACGDELNIWCGSDELTIPFMALGAKGVISVAANLLPAEVKRMTDHCLSGDYRDAARLQIRYNSLIRALFSEVNPIPVKAAMHELGLCSGELRLPLSPLSDENLQKLKKELAAAGLT